MSKVGVIIPCYGSMYTIRPVVEDILRNTAEMYSVRIILVNDNSPDGVWREIVKLCEDYSNVIGINLSRNFGQQSARMAAIPYVEGEYIVFMDDDGQHDPAYIPAMINKLEEGYDIVYASFEKKEQAKWKSAGSDFHQFSSEWLEEKPKGIRTSSFFVVRRYIVNELKNYPSPSPIIFGYLMKTTQNIATIPVPHKARIQGASGYNFQKLIQLWVNAVTSFSIVPLRLSSCLGFVSAGIGMVAMVVVVARKILQPEIAAGYTSIIAVFLFFSGIMLLMIGLLGEYLGRMFMTINHVPQYVIKEVICNQFEGDKNNV